MRRREFIAVVGTAVATWPFAARSQQIGKIPHLGILNPGTADPPGTFGFYKGLRELGYTEGQNIAIERRCRQRSNEHYPHRRGADPTGRKPATAELTIQRAMPGRYSLSACGRHRRLHTT